MITNNQQQTNNRKPKTTTNNDHKLTTISPQQESNNYKVIKNSKGQSTQQLDTKTKQHPHTKNNEQHNIVVKLVQASLHLGSSFSKC